MSGRKDRKSRLTDLRSGTWGTSSQDYLVLALKLYSLSSDQANSFDGNVSSYPLSGIPLLVSTIRALLIEANQGIFGNERDDIACKRLADEPNEIGLLVEKYINDTPTLKADIKLLYEVRNEIVHPAHTPTGSIDSTPVGMRGLRERGLLQSTGRADSDYTWVSQLKSHKLFRWSFEIVEQVAQLVLQENNVPQHLGEQIILGYSKYRDCD